LFGSCFEEEGRREREREERRDLLTEKNGGYEQIYVYTYVHGNITRKLPIAILNKQKCLLFQKWRTSPGPVLAWYQGRGKNIRKGRI
jgi:hypothetical protein